MVKEATPEVPAPALPAAPAPPWLGWFGGIADRGRDKPLRRPPDILYAVDETPPPAQLVALAAQHVSIQAIYFLLPAVVAAAFGLTGLAATNLLCLTILGTAIFQFLQALTRGPVGAGYPLFAIPTPVFLGVYLAAAAAGGVGIGAVAALTALSGVAGLVVALLVRRWQTLVTSEVGGVVVFMIGSSLLPITLARLKPEGLDASATLASDVVAVGSLAVMILVALTRGRYRAFGVLAGTALGLPVALALGLAPPGAAELLVEAPWFALPRPIAPDLQGLDLPLALAFCVAIVSGKATVLGNVLAFQRAADGDWHRPDGGPMRRGLVAHGLAVGAAGLLGGIAPVPSSACVGLAIATKTLSRAVAVAGACLLLVLACSPKLAALFVLLPDAIKAAMLGYVCCFMMAAGCQLITARMLDARRIFVVGLGLSAGLGALTAPDLVRAALPPGLAAPLTIATLVAFGLNLATQPLVMRQARFELAPEAPGMPQDISDRCEALGGAWGVRRETMERAKHALLELAEVLAARGVVRFAVQARLDDDLVRLVLVWPGPPLPPPAARPDAADLLGAVAAQEGFAVWLATRQAQGFAQRPAPGGGTEARLEFAD